MTYLKNTTRLLTIATLCAIGTRVAFAQFKSYDPHNPNPTQWDVDQARNAEMDAMLKGQHQKALEAGSDAAMLEDRMRQNQQRQNQQQNSGPGHGMSASQIMHHIKKGDAFGRFALQGNTQNEGFSILPTDQELAAQAVFEVGNIARLEKNKPDPRKFLKWGIYEPSSSRSQSKQLAKNQFKCYCEVWCNQMASCHAAGFDRWGKEAKIKDAMAMFDLYAKDYDSGWFQTTCPNPGDYKKWDKLLFVTHYVNFAIRSSYPLTYDLDSQRKEIASSKEYRLFISDRDKDYHANYQYKNRSELKRVALDLWEKEWGK